MLTSEPRAWPALLLLWLPPPVSPPLPPDAGCEDGCTDFVASADCARTEASDCAWSCDERRPEIDACCARCSELIWAAACPVEATSMMTYAVLLRSDWVVSLVALSTAALAVKLVAAWLKSTTSWGLTPLPLAMFCAV